MSLTVAATIVVQKNKNGAHHTTPQCQKKDGNWNGSTIIHTSGSNLLNVSPWAEKAHKLLEIKKKRCSIEEVMEKLHYVDEVNFGSALHTFCH